MKDIITIIFLGVFITLFTACSTIRNSCKKLNTLEYSNLKGKVKEVKVSYCDRKDMDSMTFINSYYEIYNEKGFAITFTFFDNGVKDEIIKYKYDIKGNKIESGYYNKGDTLLHRYISKFDDKGRELEATNYDASGTEELKFVYTNDKNGDILETKCYDKNGYYESINYKYDKNRNRIETEILQTDSFKKGAYHYSADWVKQIVKHDKFRNEIEVVKYNENNGVVNKYNYKFDSKGNLEE